MTLKSWYSCLHFLSVVMASFNYCAQLKIFHTNSLKYFKAKYSKMVGDLGGHLWNLCKLFLRVLLWYRLVLYYSLSSTSWPWIPDLVLLSTKCWSCRCVPPGLLHHPLLTGCCCPVLDCFLSLWVISFICLYLANKYTCYLGLKASQ